MKAAFHSSIALVLMALIILGGTACKPCVIVGPPPFHKTPTRTPTPLATLTPTPTPSAECAAAPTLYFFSDASQDDDYTYYERTAGSAPAVGWELPGYSNAGWDNLGVFCIGIPQFGVASLPQAPLASALPFSRGAGNTGCPHADDTHADWLAPAQPAETCTPGYPTYKSGDIWYMRRDLTIACPLDTVRIQVAVDNVVAVYFDGVELGEDGGYYPEDVDTYSATTFLSGTHHTLAFRVTNHDDCSQTGVSYVVEVTTK